MKKGKIMTDTNDETKKLTWLEKNAELLMLLAVWAFIFGGIAVLANRREKQIKQATKIEQKDFVAYNHTMQNIINYKNAMNLRLR